MDSFLKIFLLFFTGLIAGLIDSVAGGGGLITIPMLSIVMGPGALAVGTNKVAAVCSSLFALWIYMRHGHVVLKGNRRFAILIGVGALIGASFSPYIPSHIYRWMLVIVCPAILFVVYRKDLWARAHVETLAPSTVNKPLFWTLGFLCGFYDGIAGPGGGTLMFLSLYIIARVPLLAAMATAKVANLSSATVSLVTFSISGHVKWITGSCVAAGISIGAFCGAYYVQRLQGKSESSSNSLTRLARFALLSIATLLLLKLILT